MTKLEKNAKVLTGLLQIGDLGAEWCYEAKGGDCSCKFCRTELFIGFIALEKLERQQRLFAMIDPTLED